MESIPACPCGCSNPRSVAAHAIVAALLIDDLDCAIELGLLGASACAQCSAACVAILQQAREARLRALAARERYRTRQARLQRRAESLQAKRAAAIPAATAKAPGLPAAAAAALARAKARAAGNEAK